MSVYKRIMLEMSALKVGGWATFNVLMTYRLIFMT
jgi:hypothetical protein